MSEDESGWRGPQVRTGPLIIGAALVGAGALIAFVGLAVGASQLVAATRQWVKEMDVPPSELAKMKLAQARAAVNAGAAAWQDGTAASPAPTS